LPVHAGFLLGLLFNSEMEATCSRNVGWFSNDNTALYPRRQRELFTKYLTLFKNEIRGKPVCGTHTTAGAWVFVCFLFVTALLPRGLVQL
jgi:hypothetical protein